MNQPSSTTVPTCGPCHRRDYGTNTERFFAKSTDDDLKGRSMRGGLIAVSSQGLKFILRMGSMMALARLLSPEDFGLQGMVAALTGFLGIFRDAGLSAVTVQRDIISPEQVSTLFWINIGLGILLFTALAALSPVIATFYQEPRLLPISVVSATAFLFNGLAVQHLALLQRHMRFIALAIIEVTSLALSAVVGVCMAAFGCRYWALVGMTVAAPIVTGLCAWLAVPWVPGLPRRDCALRSMLSFGGILTCNSLIVYLGYNAEKVLLGRFWGAQALGLYGRAYQLISIPSEQINSALSAVAFPSLALLQNDAARLSRAFLKGYSIVLSLTIPTTICCAVFAKEIILFVLGSKWMEAVQPFRLLTPTILVFALINPFAWLLISSGRVRRSLNLSLLIAPSLLLGAVLGLQFGPNGVALAISTAMTLLVIPIIAYAKSDSMTGVDILRAITKPLVSGIVAAIAGLAVEIWAPSLLPLGLHILLGVTLVFVVHFLMLFYVMGQKPLFVDLFKQFLQISDRTTS